ncbi:MAG: pseudouridine synthase, partial [Bacteroidota bacterium]
DRDRDFKPRSEGDREFKPKFGGDRDGGFKPKFGGDRDRDFKPRSEGDREFKPKFGGDRDGGFKPKFGGDRDRDFKPRSEGDREFKPKFGGDRDGGFKPKFGGDRDGGFKPKFGGDRDGGFKPKFGGDRDGGFKPKFGGDRDGGFKPKFGGDREGGFKQRNISDGDSPRPYNREDRGGDERPKGFRDRGAEYFDYEDRSKTKREFVPREDKTSYSKPQLPTKQDAATERDTVRLNRYIANSGICSRRDADALIAAGNISVNGVVITEMGHQVNPGDTVKYGNRELNREKPVYVLLNKPKDYITTTEDPEERKTVMELVRAVGSERIYPVGRLDRNTTGLLLLTNDGELAEKLAHPSYNSKKIYQADLNKPLSEEDELKIIEGLELEDGPVTVDDFQVLNPERDIVGLEIHIGRNRVVRRLFEHLGYEVVRLDRVMYAGLSKKDLPKGHWRHLTEREVIRLKHNI